MANVSLQIHTHNEQRIVTKAKLNSYLDGACSEERHDDGDNIDSQLELEEFGDGIVHVATPHDGLDDAREVVVSEDDVRCLLSNVCASDTLLWKTKGDNGELTEHLFKLQKGYSKTTNFLYYNLKNGAHFLSC